MKRGACSALVLMALLATAHADPSPVAQDPAIDRGPGSAGSDAPPAGSSSTPVSSALAPGTWQFRLVTGDAAVECSGTGKPECAGTGLLVENASDQTLGCTAIVTMHFGGREMTFTRAAVVQPRTSRLAITVAPPATVTFNSSDAQCKQFVRPPPLPKLAPECHAQYVSSGNPADYYPAPSRRFGEEGVVLVQVTLDKAEGPPANAHVVRSSLYDRLDEAAVRLAEGSVIRTTCPGMETRMPVNFALTP